MTLEPENMMASWHSREDYRLLPAWGFARGGVMLVLAMTATFLLANVLQARSDLRDERAFIAQSL